MKKKEGGEKRTIGTEACVCIAMTAGRWLHREAPRDKDTSAKDTKDFSFSRFLSRIGIGLFSN